MSIGLGFQMALKQGFTCSVCKVNGGHADDCLAERRDRLNRDLQKISCPECQHGMVGVNTSDYYECNNCHTQFATSELADTVNPKRVLLIDDWSGNYFPALVLAKKGAGQVVSEMQIAEINKKIEAIRKSKKRQLKK